MKIQISLDDKLAEKMDDYVQANYMSRSGFIALAVHQYLSKVELSDIVKEMSFAVQLISKRQDIDKDVLDKIKDLDRLCTLVVSSC